MLTRIYILAAFAFCSVFLWAAAANFDYPGWEYAYYLSGKLLALWAVDTGAKWIKYLPFEFDVKLKIREVFKCVYILFLIRIVWEILAITKGYIFMMQSWSVAVYLGVILCLIGYLMYSIRRLS